MILWRTIHGSTFIEPVEGEILGSGIWFRPKSSGRRELIDSKWHKIHPTWETAHRHLIGENSIFLTRARRQLAELEKASDKLQAMKEPNAEQTAKAA